MRDQVQEAESKTAEGLNEGPEVVQKFRADLSAIPAEEWRREEGGKVGDAEHKAVLRRRRA